MHGDVNMAGTFRRKTKRTYLDATSLISYIIMSFIATSVIYFIYSGRSVKMAAAAVLIAIVKSLFRKGKK